MFCLPFVASICLSASTIASSKCCLRIRFFKGLLRARMVFRSPKNFRDFRDKPILPQGWKRTMGPFNSSYLLKTAMDSTEPEGNPHESIAPKLRKLQVIVGCTREKWCTLKTKVLSNMACLVVYVQFHSISIFATSPFHSRQATRTSLCQALWQNSTLMRTTWWRWAALKEEPFFGCQDAGENWYGWWKKSCTSWYGKYPIIIHYLQGFIHPRWCRISSINSIRWY